MQRDKQMLRRRSLLLGGCGIVSLTAFAKANALAAVDSDLAGPPKAGASQPAMPLPMPTLRIAGWETAEHAEQSPNADVWISINRSWKASWR
jgi:hypothetical protein